MRPIDADVVIKHIEEYWEMVKRGKPSRGMTTVMQNIKTIVNSLPTVDAELLRHGKWRFVKCATGLRSQCSECLHWVDAGTDRNYCPYCGARMDK